MTLSSLAIVSRTEDGSDKLLYIKEFKSKHDNDADMDFDLFHSLLIDDEDDTMTKEPGTNDTSSNPTNSKHSKECSIHHQFRMQSALETLNQDIQYENNLRISFHQQFRGIEYMWIGLICVIDEYRFYGYITNTNVKMIVSVLDDISPEEEEAQTSREDQIKKTLVSQLDCGWNVYVNF